MIIRTIKAHKAEIVDAAGKNIYLSFIAATISLYVVIFITMVLLFATGATAATVKTDKQIVKQFIQKTYGSKYKIRIAPAEDTPDRVLEHRKGKKIIYVDMMKTKSCGNYGTVTTKGPFYKSKVNYPTKITKGKRVAVYLVYSPFSNSTEDVAAVIAGGKIK